MWWSIPKEVFSDRQAAFCNGGGIKSKFLTADNAEGSQDSENQDTDRTEDVQQNAGNEQEDDSQNTKGQPEETTEGTDDSQMKIYTEDQLQVDENGNVVDGDLILYICGKYMKEQGLLRNNKIVTTVMSNRA